MATPLVAGCAAVVREHLIKGRGIERPSAALVKALLINGARDLPGQYTPSEAGPIPNHDEGFGAVDMAATVGDGAGQVVLLLDEGVALDTDDMHMQQVVVAAAGQSLKVTLVWTDPPGPELVNDLDLIVRAGGQARHGNVPAGNPGFDRVNNVEQVEWRDVPIGAVDIVVRAHRVGISVQTFALVARLA